MLLLDFNTSVLFRKVRQGRQGGCITLYVGATGVHGALPEELTESRWVRIKRRAGTGDRDRRTGTVGFCYRPLDQEDQEDETIDS